MQLQPQPALLGTLPATSISHAACTSRHVLKHNQVSRFLRLRTSSFTGCQLRLPLRTKTAGVIGQRSATPRSCARSAAEPETGLNTKEIPRRPAFGSESIFSSTTVELGPSCPITVTMRVVYPTDLTQPPPAQWFLQKPSVARRPVVIFAAGAFCESYSYFWLARHLTEVIGAVVVLPFCFQTAMGACCPHGIPSLYLSNTPMTFEDYMAGASTPALQCILDTLQQLNEQQGPLNGGLDLERIAFGGHSAGGKTAVEHANSEIFPQVKAAFTYGASFVTSPVAAVTPFFDAWSVQPFYRNGSTCPILLMAGTNDGLRAYTTLPGTEDTTPTERSFDEGVPAKPAAAAYIAVLQGANHMVVAHPTDDHVFAASVDEQCEGDPQAFRNTIAELITLFLEAHLLHDVDVTAQSRLCKLLSNHEKHNLAAGKWRGADTSNGS
eukprot:jgi/Chlat1/6852/Chrsp51S00509